MRAFSLAVLASCLAAGWAAAQQAPAPAIPGAVEPGRQTNPNLLRRLPQAPEAQMNFSFPTQRRSEQSRSSDLLAVDLKRLEVEGATIVPPSFWEPLVAPLLTRPVTLPEIVAIADAIQARYVALGYTLTRAYVPPQEFVDGVLTIKVVEGYVDKIRVEGASPATTRRLERLGEPVHAARPVNQSEIERFLLLANELPGVSLSGSLKQGEQPGAADVLLTATEKSWALAAGGSNRATRYTGPWTAFVDAAANDTLGWGEQLGATVSGAPKGLEQWAANGRWVQPLGDGLALSSTLDYGKGKPGAGLQAFALKTSSASVGQNLAYPLMRSRRRNLAIEIGWTAQRSRINLLGSRFSTDQWRTVDIGLNASEAGFLGGGTVASIRIIHGLDALGATPHGSEQASRLGANPSFTKFVAELQRLQPLPAGLLLVLRASGQYTPDTIFAGEEFSLGGGGFGRGYNPSDLSGGSGFGTTAELRATWQTGLSYLASLAPYVFFDWGQVWQSATANTFLRSAGAGLRLDFGGGRSVTLEVAQPLRDLPVIGAEQPGTRFFVDLALVF
jgi:hemolysin activation/secretion protein